MKSLFALLFTLVAVNIGIACTCLDYEVPTCSRISNADTIFIGKIKQITPGAPGQSVMMSSPNVGSSSGYFGFVKVDFEIQQNYKGNLNKTISAYTSKGTSCDIGVREGDRWLIFAIRDKETGTLSFGACGGNQPLESDEMPPEDLAKFANGTLGSSIAGRLARDRFSDSGIYNAKVTITRSGILKSGITDANGKFNIPIKEPGEYLVKVVVPFPAIALFYAGQRSFNSEKPTEQSSAFSYKANVSPNTCDYQSFEIIKVNLDETASVAMPIVDHNNVATAKFSAELCRYELNEILTLRNCEPLKYWEEDKTFYDGGLTAGKYVVVLNQFDFPEYSSPFRRTYYPGTTRFAKAKIISVKNREEVILPKWKLPLPVSTKNINGNIYWENGKQLSQESLSLNKPQIRIQFYDPQRINMLLEMSDELKLGEIVEDNIKLGLDGSFSLTVFQGATYTIRITAFDKQDHEFVNEFELNVDTVKGPLRIVLKDIDK